MRSDDPIRDFERHDREQQRNSERFPMCDYCYERIFDDHYFEVETAWGTEILCEACMIEKYRRNTNDYLRKD